MQYPKSSTMPLSALSLAVITAFSGHASADESTNKIETIEVTATKRSQNIQETPVAVSALSAEALAEQNIGNFDDFARYVPNLTLGGRGPGQNDVFIRGMAIQPITVMLSGAQGTMPNVALYVDEQPVTAPGRNLDLYATDLQRIEILPGPQGTLFGASSQAGTIRYITNKPTTDGFAAGFSTRLESTKNGEMSTAGEGFINLPLSDDLAFRAAIYSVQRGGYIDNVAGEFTLDPALNPNSSVDLGPDATYESTSNLPLVEEDFNDSSYEGGRFGLKYFINNDWTILLQHTTQSLVADGVFDFDPEVGDLQVQRYFPDSLEDDINLTNVVVEGDLDDLNIVYAGAFLDRDVEQNIDYTGYNNSGGYIAYYTCTYTNPDYIVNYNIDPQFITENRECKDPTKGFMGKQEHKRMTHELRVSADLSDQVSITAGVFYDDTELKTQDDYVYLSVEEIGFAPNAPISIANSVNPNTRPAGVAFFNDITRSEEQIAVFSEVNWKFAEQWATFGLRWYDLETDYTGSSNFADGIFQGSQNTDRGRDYDTSGGHSDEPLSESGVIPKFNIAYTSDAGDLFYATYSEGFRPGGFNRGGGIPSSNPEFPTVAVTYETDDVKNYEFGWKILDWDAGYKWNGNMYYIDWSNMQTSRFDPQNVSILTFIENAADSEIRGIETDIEYLVNDNTTLYAAFSYNDTELTATNAQVIEMAPVGSELPLTPKFQGNIRVRYDWAANGYDMDLQLGTQFAAKSYSSIVASEREEQDSYSIFNASYGVTLDSWRVKFYIDNITDERATLFINTMDDIRRISTNRPRTVGMSVNYSYF